MNPRAPAFLLLALLAPEIRAASNDALFVGGPFDGHALSERIGYVAPAPATDRFRGGGFDGNAFADGFFFAVPAAATDRFRGGGYPDRDRITIAWRSRASFPTDQGMAGRECLGCDNVRGTTTRMLCSRP